MSTKQSIYAKSAQQRSLTLDDTKLRYEVAGNGPLGVVLLNGWPRTGS